MIAGCGGMIELYAKFLEMWKNADMGLPQPEHAKVRPEALKGI